MSFRKPTFKSISGNHFSEQTIFQKTEKTIGLLRKIQTLLPRAPLITIYKSIIRPHLDYDDVVYDQTFNMSFQKKGKPFSIM